MESACGFLKPGERLDDLHRAGLMLIQNPVGFCFGIDAVLLSDFAKAKAGEHVLDLCSGSGVISLLMSAKTKAEHFTALELQPELVDMAARSVKLNGLHDRISVVCGDLRDCRQILPSAGFDVVTANPPYMNEGGGKPGSLDSKAISRHELTMTLDGLCAEAARILRFSGRFYMVHRPHRLIDIFEALRKYKLEPKTLRLVQPFIDSEPNLALIEAVRGGKPMLRTMPVLIVYDENKNYRDEVLKIYYE